MTTENSIDKTFNDKVVNWAINGIGVIIISVAISVISNWYTEPDKNVVQNRRLDKMENTIQNIKTQLNRIEKKSGSMLPISIAEEKFGRIKDKIDTANGRIIINSDNIKENREVLKKYFFKKNSSYNLNEQPSIENASYSIITDPKFPRLPDRLQLKDQYVYNKREYQDELTSLNTSFDQ